MPHIRATPERPTAFCDGVFAAIITVLASARRMMRIRSLATLGLFAFASLTA